MPRTFVWHRSRGPKHTPKQEAPTDGKVKITQVRSGIGHSGACAWCSSRWASVTTGFGRA